MLAPAGAAAQAPAPAPASAASNQDIAREKAENGLKLFGADRFEEAYNLFDDAYKLFPAPTLVLYMARCQRKLGKLVEARALYEKLLAEPIPEGASAAFHEAQSNGETELAALRQRIPTLKVSVKGALKTGARVLLDGVPLALAPARKELNPGRYTLVATADDTEAVVRTVTLAEGASETIELTIAGDTRSGGTLVPALAAFGVGVAGLGVGAVTGGLVIGKASDLKARCMGNLCPASDKDEADAARALGTVSTVAFVVGAAGVTAGVVLLIVRPKGSKSAASGEGALRARVGLGTLGLEGRF